MATLSIAYPALIHPRRDARNGMYPSTSFYSDVGAAENHITAYRKKEVFRWNGFVTEGDVDSGVTVIPASAGAVNLARWHFHTGYGTTRLRAKAIMVLPSTSGADAYVKITVTVPGGATSTFAPEMHAGGTAADPFDAPDAFVFGESSVDVTANQTYEGLVELNDYARLVALTIYEETDAVVDESTDFYNEQAPQSGSKIFDAHRQRLAGLTNMWRRNGGLQCNWSREAGATRTRTSSTAINLIDNSTTGTPTANTPGWMFDGASRTTVSRAVIPCRLAVYASMSSGSGTVRVTDTAGTSPISVTVNNATPQWFTSTGNLVASATKKYDPMFLSDGTNTLTVYGVSLYEYEA